MRAVLLVPRRAGQPDRDRIWEFCRARWELDLPEYPVVVGEHEGGPFNRSAALNRAAAAAGEWDVAVCLDADVIVGAHQIRPAVQLAGATGGPVLAYDERMHLSPKGTNAVLRGYQGSWLSPGFVLETHHDSCSSAYVVTRDLWEAVGGFDEAFVGWGWEDIAFRCATETMSGTELTKIGGKLWHLYHVVSSGNNRLEETFKANGRRGAKYRSARMRPAAMSRLISPAPVGQQRRAPDYAAGIPKILHRTVPAARDPQVERWWTHARRLHPGWEIRTYRDPLDPASWPRTAYLWERCSSGAQRAGLIRLEALARDGGVYLDSDVELYRPLDPLLRCSAFAGWEDAKVVPDAVLGAVAHHPAIEEALARSCKIIEGGGDAWASGPGVTTAIFPGRPDVLLLPPGSFYPWHYTVKDERHVGVADAQPWAFGAHHWHGSWLPK